MNAWTSGGKLKVMTAPLRAQPIVQTDPARRHGIDLNALAQEELRLETAPLSALDREHRELGQWLELPGAELWADQHREKSERIKRVWQTIKRRFPEYAARITRDGLNEHERGMRQSRSAR